MLLIIQENTVMTQKGGGHGPVVKREECSQTGGSRLSAPLAFFIGSSTVFFV